MSGSCYCNATVATSQIQQLPCSVVAAAAAAAATGVLLLLLLLLLLYQEKILLQLTQFPGGVQERYGKCQSQELQARPPAGPETAGFKARLLTHRGMYASMVWQIAAPGCTR